MSQNLQGHYAGFVSRVIAYILDGVVLALSLGVTAWFISTMRSILALQSIIGIPILSNNGQFVLTGTTWTIIAILYPVFFWSLLGQTPGLKFMGLRVVTLDGQNLSLKRSAVRMVGYILSTLPLYLGFAWILIDDRRQGWHDKLARTCVIYDWEARYGGKYLTRALDQREERVSQQTDVQRASASNWIAEQTK